MNNIKSGNEAMQITGSCALSAFAVFAGKADLGLIARTHVLGTSAWSPPDR